MMNIKKPYRISAGCRLKIQLISHPGTRSAIAWSSNKLKVRIPWTMLYFYDPTRMSVINGAISNDGGYTFKIETAQSDGIALSVYYKGSGCFNY